MYRMCERDKLTLSPGILDLFCVCMVNGFEAELILLQSADFWGHWQGYSVVARQMLWERCLHPEDMNILLWDRGCC
jgi:hypothetical protein